MSTKNPVYGKTFPEKQKIDELFVHLRTFSKKCKTTYRMGGHISYVSDKGPVSRICKNLLKFSNKRKTEFKNGQRNLSRPFSKEDRKMANNHMKSCSNYVICSQGNAHPNHSELLPHTTRLAFIKKL